MSDRQEIERKNAVILHEIVQKMAECVRGNDEKYRSDAALLRKYIDENYEKALKIDTLCELIYRSRSQTIRIFKNSFGITPYEYILSRKMQVAKRMLRDTRMPVREISSTLGFSNEHYFSARFKTYNGITPGQYRKNSSI